MATGKEPGAGMQPPETVEEFLDQFGDQCTSAAETRRLAAWFFRNEGTIRRIIDRLKERKKGNGAPRAQGGFMGTRGKLAAIFVAVMIGSLGLVGCGQNSNQWGDVEGGKSRHDRNVENWGRIPKPVVPVQHWGRKDTLFFADGKVGLDATAADTTLSVYEGTFPSSVTSATTWAKIIGTSNAGVAITLETKMDPVGTRLQKKFTAAEHPAGDYKATFVKKDVNGLVVSEAALSADVTKLGGQSISYSTDGLGNFYFEGSESAPELPGNVGDIRKTRLWVTRNAANQAEYSLSIRNEWKAVRVLMSSDGYRQHDVMTSDVNGWSELMPFVDLTGSHEILDDGATQYFVLAFELDGASSDTGIGKDFDFTGSKYLFDVPYGSSTKKGIRFVFADGIVFGGTMTTIPVAPTSITVKPATRTETKGATFSFTRIVGFYPSWRTSVVTAGGLTSSITSGILTKVSELSYTAGDIGTANVTFSLSGATAVSEVSIVGEFKEWNAAVDKTSLKAVTEKAIITVTDKFKDGSTKSATPTRIENLDPSIAIATQAGEVRGLHEGKARFRVYSTHNDNKVVEVTIESHVKQVVAEASPSLLPVTGKGKFKTTRENYGVDDDNITALATTTYVSDKPGVLKPNDDGTYEAFTEGVAVVTITDTLSTKSTTVTITVEPKPIIVNLVLPKTALNAGDFVQASLDVISSGGQPANKAAKGTWRSLNPAIATVGNDAVDKGKITATANAVGTVEIEVEYLGIVRRATVTVSRTLSGLRVAIAGNATSVPHDGTVDYTVTAEFGTVTADVTGLAATTHVITGSLSIPQKGKIKGDAGSGIGSIVFSYSEGGVTKTATVTLGLTPKINSCASTPASVSFANNGSPVDGTLTTTLSDNTTRASQNVTFTITPTGASAPIDPATAPIAVTITTSGWRIAPVASRSGSGTVVFTEAGKSTSVGYSESAVLATLNPAAQVLQVGGSITLSSIPGTMNDSANTGGAAAATILISKVTVGTSSNPAVATMSAAGTINAPSAGTATIPLTSVDVPSVTATLTVTVTVAPPPPTVTSVTASITTFTLDRATTEATFTLTAHISDGSTSGATSGVTFTSAPGITVAQFGTTNQYKATRLPDACFAGPLVATYTPATGSPVSATIQYDVLGGDAFNGVSIVTVKYLQDNGDGTSRYGVRFGQAVLPTADVSAPEYTAYNATTSSKSTSGYVALPTSPQPTDSQGDKFWEVMIDVSNTGTGEKIYYIYRGSPSNWPPLENSSMHAFRDANGNGVWDSTELRALVLQINPSARTIAKAAY